MQILIFESILIVNTKSKYSKTKFVNRFKCIIQIELFKFLQINLNTYIDSIYAQPWLLGVCGYNNTPKK